MRGSFVNNGFLRAASFSNKFQEKERGEEKNYFTKKDQETLKNLLKKMQNQKTTTEEDRI